MPEDALRLLRRLACHRQMRPQGLAEGVKVEPAPLVLKGDANAAQVLLEGFDFGNMPVERPIRGLEGCDEGPKLL